MHSLSMPLVREKAVMIFMERIAEMKGPLGGLSSAKVLASILDDEGALTVLRPYVSVKDLT